MDTSSGGDLCPSKCPLDIGGASLAEPDHGQTLTQGGGSGDLQYTELFCRSQKDAVMANLQIRLILTDN